MELLYLPDDLLRNILVAAGPADAAALAFGNRQLWGLWEGTYTRKDIRGVVCYCVGGRALSTERAASHGHTACMLAAAGAATPPPARLPGGTLPPCSRR